MVQITRLHRDHDTLHDRRQQLSQAWSSVLSPDSAGADPQVGQLGSGVLASWRRSSSRVDPELSAAPVDDTDAAVTTWRASGVAAGLRLVEGDVRRAADGGGLVAAITDATGRIVWTHGSAVMRRKSEQVGFVPGGHWDEASVGTNALALALRSGRPSAIFSAEHFSRAVHGWACYAVPITDPLTGQVRGVFDLSTTWDRAHPLAMTTAAVLGRLISLAAQGDLPAGGPALELTVLGGWRARVGGVEQLLPRRQLEVLVLLALNPSGLSLDQLHARLYGDAPVSTATLKAEVSHLRTALQGGIGSRPYRLTIPVVSDVQRVLDAVDRGDVRTAVLGSGGPLLPGSESPEVCEWRTYVEVALTTAVLASNDVEAVLAHADAVPYDSRVQQHLVDVLPAHDPRSAGASARLARSLS